MGSTTWWAFALAFVTTIFTSAAQILYKYSSPSLSWNVVGILTNGPFMLAWLLYGLGAMVMIGALKGGEVTVLYPVVASSYIWVLFLSHKYFGDAINAWKIAGIFIIIAGIGFISWGSREVVASAGSGSARPESSVPGTGNPASKHSSFKGDQREVNDGKGLRFV